VVRLRLKCNLIAEAEFLSRNLQCQSAEVRYINSGAKPRVVASSTNVIHVTHVSAAASAQMMITMMQIRMHQAGMAGT